MKYVVGNWKMNGDQAFAEGLVDDLLGIKDGSEVEVILCPPFPFLLPVNSCLASSRIKLGAQDCSKYEAGAHTGEVSAGMLKGLGCSYVILGHSERRQYHGELDTLIAEKVVAAQFQKLIPIVCVGETARQKNANQTISILQQQLSAVIAQKTVDWDKVLIAYEPIWAIGTGKTAEVSEVEVVHKAINRYMIEQLGTDRQIPILYGGSVSPLNASSLIATSQVSGFLVGGASLKGEMFSQIIAAVSHS